METYIIDESQEHTVADEQSVETLLACGDTAKASVSRYNIIGQSGAIDVALHQISIHGKYDAPVLITGETGTGKELAARGLHYDGLRAEFPFVAVNCATLTDELFASEIYGHKKGAFTDARQEKKGMLAVAENGTLFLDEIDSLSLKSQASLLRFLQESEYRPVGSTITFSANVRLIASANCDLEERVEQGLFRRDLYYRLYILTVNMPPLREREGDTPLLVNYFLNKFQSQYQLGVKTVSHEFLASLENHHWPGNVRELENMMHRLYLSSPETEIDVKQLASIPAFKEKEKSDDDDEVNIGSPFNTSMTDSEGTISLIQDDEGNESIAEGDESEDEDLPELDGDFDFSRDKKQAVEDFEKKYIIKLLKMTNGNVTHAGVLCNKERRAFGKLVKKYNLKKTWSWSEDMG